MDKTGNPADQTKEMSGPEVMILVNALINSTELPVGALCLSPTVGYATVCGPSAIAVRAIKNGLTWIVLGDLEACYRREV